MSGDEGVALEWDADTSTWVARYGLRRYRFLLSDGQTIDVRAYRDDSNLRGQVLVIADRQRRRPRKAKAADLPELRIEGSVHLPDVEEPELWEG